MTAYIDIDRLPAAVALLAQAGTVLEEVVWRLNGVHLEKWESPAAHLAESELVTLRAKARLVQDQHQLATTQMAALQVVVQSTTLGLS